MPVVEVSHLGKTYGSGRATYEALGDVSFAVDRGELAAIVGPSGRRAQARPRC
ncbi:hypothetical protein [Nocardioides sp. L-11A]|uniref:hypothetical protein n=1 Tax=Nocardioides sp. L-11A TaxID=3043848 RepID=UPI00249C84FB|nr:hypothetical protein QJ852_26410 [Nocardioides sp. L-11A]